MPNIFHFAVVGTHCASCEIVIERELKKLPGVVKVHASAGANTVDVTMQDGKLISAEECTKVLKQHGYSFSPASTASRPFTWDRAILAVVAVGVIYYLFTSTGILNYAPEEATGKGLVAVLLVGVVASFSSCTAVVSGFLVALSSKAAKSNAAQSFVTKMRPHFAFNIGRVVGFAGFGALVGAIGSQLALSSTMNGVLIVAIALLMIGIGIDLLNVLPASYAIRPPKFLSHRIHAIVESKSPFAPAILGAATFFLPCGFTQSMQLYALSTGSPMQAALIMTTFAIGTLPALLGVGAATSAARGKTLERLTFGVGAFVVALGIANIGNGATLLGWQGFSFASASTTVAAPVLIDGKQLVTMEASAFGYNPDVITVRKGYPVDWEIYGGKNLGCASTLIMNAFNVTSTIRPGENRIAFTPTKTGTFPFSCSMGMVRGTMVVVE